jgi:hypothetical protein
MSVAPLGGARRSGCAICHPEMLGGHRFSRISEIKEKRFVCCMRGRRCAAFRRDKNESRRL